MTEHDRTLQGQLHGGTIEQVLLALLTGDRMQRGDIGVDAPADPAPSTTSEQGLYLLAGITSGKGLAAAEDTVLTAAEDL